MYEQIFHGRQISSDQKQIIFALNNIDFNEKVTIIRVGDKLTDKLKIPKVFRPKIVNCIDICTIPEIEILIIIKENLLKAFNKSKGKPCIFCAENIKGYSKKYKYFKDYFDKMTEEEIILLLKKYCKQKPMKNHKKYNCLIDLVKENLLDLYQI